MGSVLSSTTCHYCGPQGTRATTEDHIVPRKFLPAPLSVLPYWFRQHFTVPCCKPCNGKKEWFRSTCECDQCTWVWNTALACFVPMGKIVQAAAVRRVDVAALSRAQRLAKAG